MNNMTCASGALSPAADKGFSAHGRTALLLAFTLSLGLGASLLLYLTPTPSAVLLRTQAAAAGRPHSGLQQATGLGQLDFWTARSVLAAEVGCGAFLLALVVAMIVWRQSSERRLRAVGEASRRTVAALEGELANTRKAGVQLQISKAQAQQRVEGLEAAVSVLRTELDDLKRVEQRLAEERRVLESSKARLEAHVRERTHEVRKLQRQSELILNSAGEGICGLDANGRITFANPAAAKLTGWPLEELIGKTEQEMFGHNGCAAAPDAADNNSDQRTFSHRDGQRFTVESVRTPIHEEGQVVGAVLVFKDITERKRVEEALAQQAAELARSNTELEQFAFVASHDLQEPLRKIQSFGDRLEAKCNGALGPDARDYLARMQNASARLRTLIDDLLAFSRVIRRAEPFVRADLRAVAKEVLGDLEVRIEKSGAKVEVGELPVIEADPTQMRQLLLNLIGNSLKFQPPGAVPVVKVQGRIIPWEGAADAALVKRLASSVNPTGTPQQLCELTIQDNGIGFDEKYSERIFAVFQRLHGRSEYEGTGVGLAVCRRIAERHHGAIICHSKPGEGATFIVTLPLTQPKPALPA
jgi:PAS domain S-box-containing protein